MSRVRSLMRAESRPDVQLHGAVRFAIVVPYLNDDPDAGVGLAELESAVAGVLAQTVDDWELIVVDDASPSAAVHAHLDALAARDSRIVVLRERVRGGAGHCRNVAIAHARAAQIPIVVFNDADDISHPRRLEVTGDIFATEPDTALVYSHFVPIDQDGVVIATTDYSPAIAHILNAIATQPPEGEDVWIDIATGAGYVNLTSATSVRTQLAYSHPFPDAPIAEDYHTWLRYSAAGGAFRYTAEIPSLYRMRSGGASTASRERAGDLAAFLQVKVPAELDGLERAMELAIARGRLHPDDRHELIAGYLARVARH